MTLTLENFLLIGSLLLLLSILIGKASFKYGVPTLLLFLGIGMLAGGEGVLGIQFNNPKFTQFIGVVSLNFILFSGGLDTSWNTVRPIVKEALVLSTLGVFITALSLGLFIFWLTDFTIYESLLLGSIVSSTDVAAVFSILRSKNIALQENLRPTLEMESGSNDPMAYVLMISFLTLVTHQDLSVWAILPLFFIQMLVGALFGFGFGKISKYIINNIKLGYEGLYPILMIALMFITFTVTDMLKGNGFLAIYISAIYLGNQNLVYKKAILRMYDGLAWLMQIVLFLTLGLLVNPSEIMPVLGLGIACSLFLIFAARPIAVFMSTIPFKMNINRKLYISWVGLRGAVPIVFATYPLLAGVEKANVMFNVVFFISVSSVLLQGTTLGMVAKWLKVVRPDGEKIETDYDQIVSVTPKSVLQEFVVSADCPAIGKKLIHIGLPDTAEISLLKRGETYLIPDGNTELQEHDTLVVLSDDLEGFENVKVCMRTRYTVQKQS